MAWSSTPYAAVLPGAFELGIGSATLGLVLLVVLLISVAITNAADAAAFPIDIEVTDLIGTLALRIFPAIAMLSLDWVELVAHLPLLFAAALAQMAVTLRISVFVVYSLFGRGAEGAAASGGFIGMSLGAMRVGLAVMRRFSVRFGDTPRALLADLVNAVGITGFRWLGM